MNLSVFLRSAAAVADPTRLRMLLQLGSGARSVGQLAAAVGITSSVTSYHLLNLRDAGLVVVERRGRRTLVRRVDSRWEGLVRAMAVAT